MRTFFQKLFVCTFILIGTIGMLQLDSSLTTVSAKKKLQLKKYYNSFYDSVEYYQGNGILSSTNTVTVYNANKKTVDLLITKKKFVNPYTNKTVKNLTILLENNKKIYYKNGLLYSNSKKTKLFNGKFITAKVKGYSLKAGQLNGFDEGHAYIAMQATVSKGKMKSKTIKFPVWEIGSVYHPG